MNRKWLLLALVIGGARICSAQLQFTNLTLGLSLNVTNKLRAVAYDGASNVVAVGDREVYVAGSFAAGKPLIAAAYWTNGYASSRGATLTSVASGSGLFVATGDNNLIESWNAVFGSPWTTNLHQVFVNNALGEGIAYNNGNFVVVAAAPEIGYSALPLPVSAAWTQSTINQVSIGESYRGINQYGSSSFAACGIFGVVRTSTDNGASFQLVNGNINQPDLLGIAAAGTTQLVSVGAANPTGGNNGFIMSSAYNGTSWTSSGTFTNSANGTPLYGVAYTGSRFLAVGSAGQVLSSSNGVAWVNITNSIGLPPPTNNFNGVTFATAGFLRGVGFLVADSGMLMLAAVPPPAPINPIGATNCEVFTNLFADCVSASNNTLRVDMVTNLDYPFGTTTVDWFDAASNGTQLVFCTNSANITFSFTPTNNSAMDPNHAGFYTFYAQTRDLRTGFTSTNRTPVTLRINPRPRASLASTNFPGRFATTNCNVFTPYSLTYTLTGLGTWTVLWNDGFVQTNTSTGPGPTNLTRTVIPSDPFLNAPSNNIYYITNLSNPDGCLANQPGDIVGTNVITINPRPTATITSTNFPNLFAATNCNVGSAYALTNSLTGLGPWIVWWNDGFIQTNASTGQGPVNLTRTVIPSDPFLNGSSNNVYYVTNVLNTADGCSGSQASGDIAGTSVITINPRPTTTLISTNFPNLFAVTNCNVGSLYTLTNTLTGLGPWIVWWNDGFIQTNTSTDPGPTNLTRTVLPSDPFLNALSNNVYYVTNVLNTSDGCLGSQASSDIAGTNSITINPRPTAITAVSGPNPICNSNQTAVQVALTGIGPWNFTWLSNGVPVFTTNGLAVPTHTLTVRPANPHLNSPTNTIYSITNLSDANCVALPGDLNNNSVITINPRPTAITTVIGPNPICNSNQTTVQVALTGLGPWSFTWLSNGVPVFTTNGMGVPIHTLTVQPANPHLNNATNTVYSITNLSDANCLALPGDRSSTAVITINPRPTAITSVIGPNPICNSNQTTVQVALTGVGPWNFTWLSNGVPVFTTNGIGVQTHTLTVQPSNPHLNSSTNTIYSITNLSDANCVALPGDLNNNSVITINPRPTAITTVTGPNPICNSNQTTVQVALTGISPWSFTWLSNGVPVFTTNGLTVSTHTLTQRPANPHLNNATNTVYSITNLSDANCVALPGDRSSTSTITINPRPTAITSVTGPSTICYGDQTTVQVALTGLGPWNFTWLSNGVPVFTTNGMAVSTNTLTVQPANPHLNAFTNTVFSVTNVTDANCVALPADLNNNSIVKVNPRPTAVLTAIGSTNTCSGAAVTNRVDLTGIAPWTVIWNDGLPQTTNNTPLFRVVNPINTNTSVPITTNYSVLSVSNNLTGCVGQAGDIAGMVQVTVQPRATATVTNGYMAFCFGGTVTNFAQLTGIGPWTVVWSSNGVNIQTNMVAAPTNYDTLIVTVTNTTDITIITNVFQVSKLDDATLTNCTPSSASNATVVIYPLLSAVFLTSDSSILTNSGTPLTLMLTGTKPWHLTWSDGTNEIATTNIWTRTVYGTNIANFGSSFDYYLTSLTDGSSNCPAQNPLSDTNTVTLVAQPLTNLFVVFGGTTICAGQCTTNVFIYLTNHVANSKNFASPWIIQWSDSTYSTSTCVSCSGMIGYRTACPTNTTTYTALSVKAKSTTDGSHNTWSGTNFIGGSATVTVSPLPSGVVLTNISQVSCAGVTNPPLFVVFTNGDGGNWYDQSGDLLAANTISYVSTNINASVLHFFVKEVNANGCTNNAPGTPVSLIHTNCSAFLITIQPLGNTNVLIKWFGNQELQSASNLNPPVAWSLVTNPLAMGTNYFIVGTNYWTNAIQLPIEFFRVSSPTN
jgi:hypothetical protein